MTNKTDLKTAVKAAIAEIVEKEGGYTYVNDPLDSGGETFAGVTIKTARAYGYKGDMQKIPHEVIDSIYEARYLKPVGFNAIYVRSPLIAEKLLDFGVLCGISRSVKSLQRCLNVLNGGGSHWSDIKVDGIMGNNTKNCLDLFFKHRGIEMDRVLFEMIDSLQGSFLIELVEKRPKDEKYAFGWFKNRIGLRNYES